VKNDLLSEEMTAINRQLSKLEDAESLKGFGFAA